MSEVFIRFANQDVMTSDGCLYVPRNILLFGSVLSMKATRGGGKKIIIPSSLQWLRTFKRAYGPILTLSHNHHFNVYKEANRVNPKPIDS
jgi:hypothetical protein